jgi:hypothetical protein
MDIINIYSPKIPFVRLVMYHNFLLHLILGYLVEFNHIPFYGFHNRTYSITTKAFFLAFKSL